jgi:hypothetical protein
MYYKNDTSYQDHPFCTVINYLDDNDILFEDINFSLVQLALDGVKADKNRGNHQTNYGYATLNVTDIDEESSIRRPNLVNNTRMQSDNFIALSQLLKFYHLPTATTFTIGSQVYHVDGSPEEVINFYNKFDKFTDTDDGPGRFRFSQKKAANVFCVVNYFYNNTPKAKSVLEKRQQFIQKNNINLREYTTLVDAVTNRKMFCIWRKKKGCYMIQYVGIYRFYNNDWKPFCHKKNE